MNEIIRVLHVFGRLDSGGAESRTMDIYREIDRTKIQFDFVIHTEDKCFFTDEIKSLGGIIYNFPRFNGKNYFKYKKSWNQFFKKHPSYKIIHGHQTNTGFVYLKVARNNNVPIRIAHSRNSQKENIIKKHMCKLSKLYATDLFAVSKLAAISEFGIENVDKNNVKIIPNAINAYKYTFDQEVRADKRLQLGINDKFVVGHIGRFHAQKNHMFLLETFKLLKERHKESVLLLVGEGELRKEIENKIKELNIKDSVILTGIRSDIPEILQAMDVLFFPSHFEGLPGVILEAQASGLPCIISSNITKEVKVTDLVNYISLNNDKGYWMNKILDTFHMAKRRSRIKDINNAGYDIKSVTRWYERFYLKGNFKYN